MRKIQDVIKNGVSVGSEKGFNKELMLMLLKNGIISAKKFVELCGGAEFITRLHEEGYINDELTAILIALCDKPSANDKPSENTVAVEKCNVRDDYDEITIKKIHLACTVMSTLNDFTISSDIIDNDDIREKFNIALSSSLDVLSKISTIGD